MKSVNKNFIYNSVYQLLLYLIPLILTPYISRTLGANNIGVYSYTYSIVYYFMLATLLGINNYGSRNIAQCSEDRNKIKDTFSTIYGLQVRVGIIMLIVYNIIVFVVMKKYFLIALIHNFFLLSAVFDINWLYFGLEKFKVTITRNVIIKILSLICVFAFVRSKNDLWIYTLIMSLSTLISQLYLFILLKKYADIRRASFKEAIVHLKGCLILFVPVLAYSIYRVMDKTLIGAIASTYELGLFDNSEKIINIPISILTAMGTVMLPYMSKQAKDKSLIEQKILSSFEMCFCFMVAMMFGLLAISDDFSIIYFGSGFEKCGEIIKLLVPSILFTSIANVVRTNYLIPLKKDNIYVISTIIGAIINLVINVILIGKYGALGACVGTTAAEFSVMFYQIICVRKEINLKNVFKIMLKYLLKGLVMYLIIVFIGLFIKNIYIRLVSEIVLAVIIYFILCRKYIIYDFLGRKRNETYTVN